MYPIILEFKLFNFDLTIGGYGLMLGLAFYLSFLFFERELKFNGLNPDLAYKILITIIPAGIIGSKVGYIIEFPDQFKADPWGTLFSGSGLSIYGGFLLAIICMLIIIRLEKLNTLRVFDLTSPAMALGYGIGRIGCHVAGDGCYGINTSSFLGLAYPNGFAPISETVFPTSLFESIFSFMVFVILMQYRKKELPVGKLFFIYLIINGCARFLIEFIRIKPELILGLTHAQFVGLALIIGGAIGILRLQKRVSTV